MVMSILNQMEHIQVWRYKFQRIIYVSILPSLSGTGVVGDIFFKRADFVAGPIAILQVRALYVDYMPEVEKYDAGIYIPSLDNAKEAFRFTALLKPLRYAMIL